MADDKNATRFRTPEFRGSYVSVMKARQMKNDDGTPKDPEFEITMVLPKENPFWKTLAGKIREASMKKFGKVLPTIKLGKEKYPIKDADEYLNDDGELKRPEWAGCYFARMHSKSRPGVVKRDDDGDLVDVIERDEIYSGAWYVCGANAGGWTHSTGKGVSLYLNNVLKIKDDAAFGGGPSPDDDFSDYVGTVPEASDDDEDGDPLA